MNRTSNLVLNYGIDLEELRRRRKKKKLYPIKIVKHVHIDCKLCHGFIKKIGNFKRFLLIGSILIRHTGDTGFQAENYYEPRHRYSLSDVITHIKRSIPDLRTIKHQPLENKESPCGSPKHHAENGAGTSVMAGKSSSIRHQGAASAAAAGPDTMTCCDKETDAVTLSAIQTTSCTCGPTRGAPNENIATTQIDKAHCELDEDDAMLSANSHHHHYHYHPYQQHLHRPQSLHEMR